VIPANGTASQSGMCVPLVDMKTFQYLVIW